MASELSGRSEIIDTITDIFGHYSSPGRRSRLGSQAGDRDDDSSRASLRASTRGLAASAAGTGSAAASASGIHASSLRSSVRERARTGRGAGGDDGGDRDDDDDGDDGDEDNASAGHGVSLVSLRDAMSSSEIARLGQLWRHTKTELRGKSREVARLKARVLREEMDSRRRDLADRDTRQFAEANVELRDRTRFLELQLDDTRTEARALRASYQEALTKLGESLKVLEERALQHNAALAENEELRARVEALEAERDSLVRRSAQDQRVSREELAEKADLLAQQTVRLSTAEHKIARHEEERRELVRAQERLEAEIAARNDAIRALQANVATASEEAQRFRHAAAQEGMLRAQVHHLKTDNARLVRLLATSRDYHSFVASTFTPDDDEPSGRARSSFLGVAPRAGTDSAHGYFGGGPVRSGDPWDERDLEPADGGDAGDADAAGDHRDRAGWHEVAAYERFYDASIAEDEMGVELNREGDLWVPSEALRLAVAFRRRHLRHVPGDLVREFLQRLNAVWRRRSARQLHRLKERLGRQIDELQRQLQQRAPYREVLQASTIARLHAQLNAVRRSGGYVPFGIESGVDALPATAAEALIKAAGVARSELGIGLTSTTTAPSAAGAATTASTRGRRAQRRTAGDSAADLGLASFAGSRKQARSLSRSRGATSASSLGFSSTALSLPGGRSQSPARRSHSSGRGGATATTAGSPSADDETGHPGYGWDHRWSRNFPAAALGGAAHARPWSAAREHAELMETSLATVENLSRELVHAQEEIKRLKHAAADAAARSPADDDVWSTRLEAHTRGVTWIGRQFVRLADVLGDEVSRHSDALRRAAEGALSPSQILSLLATIDREVSSFRAATRRLFEVSLEAGTSRDKYDPVLAATDGVLLLLPPTAAGTTFRPDASVPRPSTSSVEPPPLPPAPTGHSFPATSSSSLGASRAGDHVAPFSIGSFVSPTSGAHDDGRESGVRGPDAR